MWRGIVICAVLALVAGAAETAQDLNPETAMNAKRRLFPAIGPGARTLHRDAQGRYYVLAGACTFVSIFSSDEKAQGQIPAAGRHDTGVAFAEDFDVDSSSRVYIADRGGNAIRIYGLDGKPDAAISVVAPVSVAALGNNEVAIASMRSSQLVDVFDVTTGKRLRSFGDMLEIADHPLVNRYVNFGRLATDAEGHVYYSFTYFPEPTVRKYDRYGWGKLEMALATLEFQPAAHTARREIVRQDQQDASPALNPIINAIGVDPQREETWIAMGSGLVVFDRDGIRRANYRVFSPDGGHLDPRAIEIEPQRILIACDPLGVYEFTRPK
jgi:hypothetical protein